MDQLEPVAGAGESDAGGAAGRAGKADAGWKRQDEQKGQVPAERRLTGRADAGGTAGRPGPVGTGWNGRLSWSGRCRAERHEEQGRQMPAGSGRESRAGRDQLDGRKTDA